MDMVLKSKPEGELEGAARALVLGIDRKERDQRSAGTELEKVTESKKQQLDLLVKQVQELSIDVGSLKAETELRSVEVKKSRQLASKSQGETSKRLRALAALHASWIDTEKFFSAQKNGLEQRQEKIQALGEAKEPIVIGIEQQATIIKKIQGLASNVERENDLLEYEHVALTKTEIQLKDGLQKAQASIDETKKKLNSLQSQIKNNNINLEKMQVTCENTRRSQKDAATAEGQLLEFLKLLEIHHWAMQKRMTISSVHNLISRRKHVQDVLQKWQTKEIDFRDKIEKTKLECQAFVKIEKTKLKCQAFEAEIEGQKKSEESTKMTGVHALASGPEPRPPHFTESDKSKLNPSIRETQILPELPLDAPLKHAPQKTATNMNSPASETLSRPRTRAHASSTLSPATTKPFTIKPASSKCFKKKIKGQHGTIQKKVRRQPNIIEKRIRRCRQNVKAKKTANRGRLSSKLSTSAQSESEPLAGASITPAESEEYDLFDDDFALS